MTIGASSINHFTEALFSSIMLNLIPSENRNSVYSIRPTISNLFVIPLLPIVGSIIDISGLIYGVLISMAICLIGSILIFASLSLNNPNREISVKVDVIPQGAISN
ncbi:MAG: hypothetical protein HeimC2_07500 [Candidatus Heimdallarchaeota archaeon LC_2]|nr:MAG: hypothetical protein HeimC2_07500 [Candidatus Heimdallarchaeota archaeon LC_2]